MSLFSTSMNYTSLMVHNFQRDFHQLAYTIQQFFLREDFCNNYDFQDLKQPINHQLSNHSLLNTIHIKNMSLFLSIDLVLVYDPLPLYNISQDLYFIFLSKFQNLLLLVKVRLSLMKYHLNKQTNIIQIFLVLHIRFRTKIRWNLENLQQKQSAILQQVSQFLIKFYRHHLTINLQFLIHRSLSYIHHHLKYKMCKFQKLLFQNSLYVQL